MMSEIEQRIAIAEACGWRWYRRPATGPWAAKPMRALYHPQIHTEYVAQLKEADMSERQCNEVFLWREGMIPDYLRDLNAMHEAEKTLSNAEQMTFGIHLFDLVDEAIADLNEGLGYFIMAHAPAPQRAEAYLKCKFLWKN